MVKINREITITKAIQQKTPPDTEMIKIGVEMGSSHITLLFVASKAWCTFVIGWDELGRLFEVGVVALTTQGAAVNKK